MSLVLSIRPYLLLLVEKLATELEKFAFKDFSLPLVGNTEAKIMKSDEIKALLARQSDGARSFL